MPDTEHAILVTSGSRGWTWALIDSLGVTTATGTTPCQASAMETAWLTVRKAAASGRTTYPQISVLSGDPRRP